MVEAQKYALKKNEGTDIHTHIHHVISVIKYQSNRCFFQDSYSLSLDPVVLYVEPIHATCNLLTVVFSFPCQKGTSDV